MAMKQFVAMSDDELYRAEGPPGPLVPYQCGVFCWHQLREESMTSSSSNVVQASAANCVHEGPALSV
jgi:hypothetical protein